MAHYVRHGHEPSDAEIAAHGYRAFAPHRPAFVPDKDDWQRALKDCATGPVEELRDVSVEVADYWSGWHPFLMWGMGADDDD